MRRRKRGLVLGAGGTLGAAWSLGALAAIREVVGWELSDRDLVVGTSAGAVLAAILRSGASVPVLCEEHLRGSAVERATRVPDGPVLGYDFDCEPCWPGLPLLRPGSLPLLARALIPPWGVRPAALCAALLPRGRRSLEPVGQLVRRVASGRRWPADTWIVATNFLTGDRVTFGRPGTPRTSLARAVMASCAVPAWYAPVPVRRVPHVDGAVYSPSNADLLADAGLDEVYVLAPQTAVEPDQPRSPLARLERAWRALATRRALAEVESLRKTGVKVEFLAPSRDDLSVMGANMMDSARRREVLRSAQDSVRRRLRVGEVTTCAA